MSVTSTDKGLLTPDNCAVIFIDYQPPMFFGGTDTDWDALLKNALVLGRAAKMFGVPVILTSMESADFDGAVAPQLRALFPDQAVIQRSSLNAWDDAGFVAAVRKTGRRNFLLAGLWSEACLTFPALQMLEEGYGVYAVKDASRGTEPGGPGYRPAAGRAGGRGLGDGAPGLARIPTRLGQGGAPRGGNGNREAAVRR